MSPRSVSVILLGNLAIATAALSAAAQPAAPAAAHYRSVLDKYCVACHNPRLLTGNLSLDETSVDVRSIAKDAAAWEKVLHKLETGAMPPPGRPRPDAPTPPAPSRRGSRASSTRRGRARRIPAGRRRID